MTREEARQYVEHWKRVGPLLEEIRRDELRQYCHADHAQAIDKHLAAGLIHAEPRLSSGLVEMQRVFSKARNEWLV
jgi:hypothetical protein